MGVYLGDCGMESGPLMVIPKSHKGPVFDHHHDGVFVGSCRAQELGALPESAVSLPGKAGSITIHHVRTLHGSVENRHHLERRLLLLCYMAIDAWPLAGNARFNLDDFNGADPQGNADPSTPADPAAGTRTDSQGGGGGLDL